MSTSSLISTLQFLTGQINIYAGLIIFIGDIIGNLVTIFVFLSLRTLRRNSCAFYLIIISIVNIGQLSTGLLSRVTINLSGIDWSLLSLVYCKLRAYFLVVCTNLSIRRELDKQLTTMILLQDLLTFFILIPIMTMGILSLYINTTQNSEIDAKFQFANVIAVMFYYLYFAAPFYIYLCVSERFRRQLKHVLV